MIGMCDVIVRQASVNDLPQLVILLEGYRKFYGRSGDSKAAYEFLFERLREGESLVFIAFEGSRAVGFCQLYPSFSTVSLARTFILNDLFVVEEARRCGVAKELVKCVQQFSREVGAVRLTLSTMKSNSFAQRLYESLGWQKDSTFYVYHNYLND